MSDELYKDRIKPSKATNDGDRGFVIERFREAPWFPWSGWFWSVRGGGSGIAKTKTKAKARVDRELQRMGKHSGQTIADLIERSSFGTPAAKAARGSVSPERASALVERSRA